MEKYPYALFDMDGTLLDSMPFWQRVGMDYLRGKGAEPGEDLWRRLSVMSTAECALYFKDRFGLTERPEEIVEGFNSVMKRHYLTDIPAKPGVEEYLISLAEAGVTLSVVTATSAPLAQAALGRLGLLRFFSQITSCDEVNAGKDRPDIFRLALRKLGARAEEAVLYDDAYFAVRTAKSLGMQVVGVYDASCTAGPQEMRELCDVYLTGFSGLTLCPQDIRTGGRPEP